MAGELQTTISFSNGEQVTSDKMNQIIGGASFTTSAVTGTTLTVVGGKLKVGTITDSELATGSVTTPAIADGAVDSSKILDGSVDNSKLAVDAVTAVNIAANAVSTTEVLNGSLTYVKLSSGAIGTKTELQSETASKLVNAANARYLPGVAKALGNVAIISTARNLTSEYNVASATRISPTETVINLADDMALDNYVVQVTAITDGTVAATASVSNRNAGAFRIKHPAEGGTTTHISFVVFGTQA